MLNRMKIRKKLIAGFIMIGLFSLIVGAFGLIYMNKINSGTNRLYANHLMPSSYLFTVQKDLTNIGSNYLTMLYEKDVSKSAGLVGEITAWTIRDESLLQKYEATDLTDEETELYTGLKEELADYQKIRSGLDDLLMQNNFEEAAKLVPSFNESKEIVEARIRELVAVNQKEAQDAIEKSDNDFGTASAIMIIVALASLALAYFLGFLISGAISKPINRLVSEAKKLSKGDVDVDVKTDLKDEIGELMVAFGEMADNIKLQAEAAGRIAEGDLTLEIVPRSDEDLLGISMVSVIDTLKSLVNEAETLTDAAINGELGTRGDLEKFSGGYREIIEGFNGALDAIVEPLNTALPYIKAMANGEDIEALENRFKGQYADLIDNLNLVRDSIYTLLSETGKLTEAAAGGELSYRANLSKLSGGYARIVSGINQTLDSLT